MSGFKQWKQKEHSEDWILFPENIGQYLYIDEVALSDGELYAVLTNAKSRCQKGCLIAMIKGTKNQNVIKTLNKIPEELRDNVQEISLDMANSMTKTSLESFQNARLVIDRFHVAQLVCDAVQEIRIKLRREAIDEENAFILKAKENRTKYHSQVYENGDTKKQLLAKSRYLLFKSANKWRDSQRTLSEILFKEFPILEDAYNLSMMFRNIYETSNSY